MFTIKTTQKLLRTSGDPAQEMIDSQVMGLEAVHLMEKEALMEQDQLGLQAMALDQTVGIPALVLLMGLEAQATVVTGEQGMAQLVAQVLVMETVLTVGILAAVLLTAPEAQTMALEATEEHLMVPAQGQLEEAPQMEAIVMDQDQPGPQAMALEQTAVIPALVLLTGLEAQEMALEATEEHLMETVVMEQDQLELQEMALEQTVGIPALVLMVVQVQVMGLEVLEEHLMDQGMAQLVAQALVMETVLTVAIPAPVLMVAPEAQATAVTVDQGMVQVQATVTEQATAVTALTTVLSLTLLL